MTGRRKKSKGLYTKQEMGNCPKKKKARTNGIIHCNYGIKLKLSLGKLPSHVPSHDLKNIPLRILLDMLAVLSETPSHTFTF